MWEQYREVMFNDADPMERSDASAALRLHSVLHQEECAQRALEEEQQRQSTEEARFPPARKKLKRELDAEALARLEDAARTVADFENIVAVWDRLDANRERRERYHALLAGLCDKLPLPIVIRLDRYSLCLAPALYRHPA